MTQDFPNNQLKSNSRQIFDDLKSFLLIVGNSRSGSTILGSVIDSHPNAVVSNEIPGSSSELWGAIGRSALLDMIISNAEKLADSGRPSEGYLYQIGQPPSHKSRLMVIGDKLFNPTLLFLHGDGSLIPRLEERLKLPIKIIEVIRNPFDAIARMHLKSTLSLSDRIRWYFMHCEAAAALHERLSSNNITTSYHEDLIFEPTAELFRINKFLNLTSSLEQENTVQKKLFSTPHRTAESVSWSLKEIEDVKRRMERFEVLSRYSDTTYIPVPTS